MKRCPECRRDYFDDSLSYCLDDGSALLEGAAADEPMTATLPSEASTRILSDANKAKQLDGDRSIAKPSFLIAGALIVVIVSAFGIASYYYFKGSSAKQIAS